MTSSTKPNHNGRRPRALRIAPLLLLAGCATTPMARDVSAVHPEYDSDRALLSLNDIEPDPPAPEATTVEIDELSAAGVRRLSRARELHREQRYTEASLELEKALRQDPAHPDLHRMLAMTLHASGQSERVRAHLRKAVAARDDDIVAHYLFGRLAGENGEYSEAIRQFRIALKASNAADFPAFAALSHFYLAKALNAERYLTAAIASYRNYEAAVGALSAEARSEPDLASLVQINGGRAGAPISVAYEKLGQFPEAAAALESSVGSERVDTATRERLARLLARAGRTEDALAQARHLVDDGELAVDLLADIHSAAGHPERVLDEVRTLHEAHPRRVDLLLAYVDVLTRFDRADDAEAVLRLALETSGGTMALRWRLGDILSERGKWNDLLAVSADALRNDLNAYDKARQTMSAATKDRKAVADLLELAERDTSAADFATCFLLASLANEASETARAEAWLRRAIERNDRFTPARVDLAEVLLDAYRWDDAIALVSSDTDLLKADARLQRLCGQAHAGLDRFEKAEEHLEAAIQLDRADTEAAETLAKVLRRNGQPRRSQRQYESILEINPLHETAREALFEILLFDFERDRRQEAAAQLAELTRLSASPHRIARCTARLSLRSDDGPPDWDRYRRTLTQAIEENGPNAHTLELIARSYLQQDDAEAALATLGKAIAITPDDIDVLAGEVMVYNALLDYDKAIEIVQGLLTRHPNRQEWIDRLWTILLVDQRYDEALAVVSERLASGDLSEEERNRYRGLQADTLQRAKRYDVLIENVLKWHEATPNDPRWNDRLLTAYRLAERFDDAIELAREAYASDRSGEKRDALWQTYMAAERFEQAQQVVLETLEDDPANNDLSMLLITTLMFSDRHDDALALIENVKSSAQYGMGLREREIVVLQHARRFDAAIKEWRKWIREERSRAAGAADDINTRIVHELQLALGRSYVLAGRLDDAVLNLRKWVDSTDDPRLKQRYLGLLSSSYQQRDQSVKAVEALQEAYALDEMIRRDAGINNDLGYSMADQGMQLAEAERMVRFALVRQPDNGAYLDSYGWVLYKKGQFALARRWLQKAANSLEGEDPVVYDHLGDAVWRLGDHDEAVKHWQEAVRFIDEALADGDRLDLRRLRERVTAKIEAGKQQETPKVAPFGSSDEKQAESEAKESPSSP